MEKDIEILEKLIEKYDEPCGMHINPTELWQDERDAIENLINRVKELEKENREIRDWKYVIDSYEDLDKIKELDLIKIKGKEYISKDKIKEKIEELEKEQEQNRKELARGIDCLSNKIVINMSIRKYLQDLLK